MGTFRITVEIGDQSGQNFQEVEALVDAGTTFTKVPRPILEALDVPADTDLHGAARRRTASGEGARMGDHPAGGAAVPHARRLRRRGGASPPRRDGPRTRPSDRGPARAAAHTGGRSGDDQRGNMNEGIFGTRRNSERPNGRTAGPGQRRLGLSVSVPDPSPKLSSSRTGTASSPSARL